MVLSFVVSVSRVLRKPALYICVNKDADQLRGIREPDQRLCFRYIAIPKFEISNFQPSSVVVQPSSGKPEDRFSHDAAHFTAFVVARSRKY